MNGDVNDWVRGMGDDAHQILDGPSGQILGVMTGGKYKENPFYDPNKPPPVPKQKPSYDSKGGQGGPEKEPSALDKFLFGSDGKFDPLGGLADGAGQIAGTVAGPMFTMIAIVAIGGLFLWVGLNSLVKSGGNAG